MCQGVRSGRILLSAVCVTIVLSALEGDMHGAVPGGVDAVTTRGVYPVLIRNEQNAFLQVIVEVKRREEVRLQSVEFTLDGTDELGDLQSLELFYAGEKGGVDSHSVFGKPARPSTKISFRGDQELRRCPPWFPKPKPKGSGIPSSFRRISLLSKFSELLLGSCSNVLRT